MILQSIRKFLLEDAAIQAITGERIHVDEAHDSKNDYVMLTLNDNDNPPDLNFQRTQYSAQVELEFFSSNKTRAIQTKKLILSRLQGASWVDDWCKVQFIYSNGEIPDYNETTELFSEVIFLTTKYHEV